MRLYAKLLIVILIGMTLNQYGVSSARRRAAWFSLRCQYAEALGDEQMQERLVEEGRQYLLGGGGWVCDENVDRVASTAAAAAPSAADLDDDTGGWGNGPAAVQFACSGR